MWYNHKKGGCLETGNDVDLKKEQRYLELFREAMKRVCIWALMARGVCSATGPSCSQDEEGMMMNKKISVLGMLLVLVLVLAAGSMLAFAVVLPVTDQGIVATPEDSNAYNKVGLQIPGDDVANDEYFINDGTIHGSIILSEVTNSSICWRSTGNVQVTLVFVKGGTGGGGYIYDYSNHPVTSDCGLDTVSNSNGIPQNISHLVFLYEQAIPITLGVDIDGQGAKTSTVDYDWDIVKSVTPASAELDRDGLQTFTYTLTADRTAADEPVLSDVTVSGEVTVTNNGSTQATGVSVEVLLMNGLAEVDSTIANGSATIDAGDSETYTYSFSGLADLAYSVTTDVTLDNGTATNPAPQTVITDTTDVETDETAQVTDDIEDVLEDLEANGYDCVISGASFPWDLTDDDSMSYTVTVTNTGAVAGDDREVTNTATLTPSDSVAVSDDAMISVTTPGTPSDKLTAVTTRFDADAEWNQTIDYDWTIEKSVDPDGSFRLSRNEELELEYTLTATRTANAPELDGKITGTVYVTNTGENDTEDLEVQVRLLELNGDDETVLADWATISTGELAAATEGNADEGSYPFTFDGLSGDEYQVEVRTYISNGSHPDPIGQEIERPEQMTTEYTDESATVTDQMGSISGFDITAPEGFPWHIDAEDLNNDGVATMEFTVTVTNENASRGIERDLVNWGILTEDDTQTEDRDDAVVEITTPGGGGGGGDDDDDDDSDTENDTPEVVEIDEVDVTAPVLVEQPVNEVIELVELPAPAAALPATGGAMIPFAAVGSALIGLGLYLKRY